VLFGFPGVFRGLLYALPRHYWRTTFEFLREGVGSRRAPTVEDLTDLLLPARVLVPDLSDASSPPRSRRSPEHLSVWSSTATRPRGTSSTCTSTTAGLELIREYDDPAASYDGRGASGTAHQPGGTA